MTFLRPNELTVGLSSTDLNATNLAYLKDNKTLPAASNGTSTINLAIRTTRHVGLAFLNIVADTITITIVNSRNTVLYTEEFSLRSSHIDDIWDYFYQRFDRKKDCYIPLDFWIGQTKINITITAVSTTASLGELVAGEIVKIGDTDPAIRLRIKDYSTIAESEDGATTITKRTYVKKMDSVIYIDKGNVSQVFNKLSDLRATPLVFVADDIGYEDVFIIYGLLRDFETLYSTDLVCATTMSIQGIAFPQTTATSTTTT